MEVQTTDTLSSIETEYGVLNETVPGVKFITQVMEVMNIKSKDQFKRLSKILALRFCKKDRNSSKNNNHMTQNIIIFVNK